MQRAAAEVRDATLASKELSLASLAATEDSPSQTAVLLEGQGSASFMQDDDVPPLSSSPAARQDNHEESEGHTSATPHTRLTTRTEPLRDDSQATRQRQLESISGMPIDDLRMPIDDLYPTYGPQRYNPWH
ncbi:hypothetical protein MRX96_032137 [Rhipicephalus microplus]